MQNIGLDILERASSGDMAAFESIYKVSSAFVYNVALRIVRNSADAEEVTQDVFMNVYHNLNNFQRRSSFKTWVYRITVNTAINRYRKSQREVKGRVNEEGLIESLPDCHSTVDSIVQNENQSRINALLDLLRPEQRMCFVLREIDSLSYEEISEVLMIPLNTVRSRLKRAREALLEEARKGAVKDGV
jgi:RNA polymerase sigma-70 factor (ECF subfamily)